MFSTLFGFLKPYLMYIKLGLIAAAIITISVLYGTTAHYKAKVIVLTAQIAQCQDANKTNAATITSLTKERDGAAVECVTRLSIKDDYIKKLQTMLNKKGDAANEKPSAISSGDDVFDLLNGVYPKANSKSGVCQGASGSAISPSAGPGSGVLLRRYCFATSQDAINFLVNIGAHWAREQDLESIIMSHQTKSTP
jgi:hypothetical protein